MGGLTFSNLWSWSLVRVAGDRRGGICPRERALFEIMNAFCGIHLGPLLGSMFRAASGINVRICARSVPKRSSNSAAETDRIRNVTTLFRSVVDVRGPWCSASLCSHYQSGHSWAKVKRASSRTPKSNRLRRRGRFAVVREPGKAREFRHRVFGL